MNSDPIEARIRAGAQFGPYRLDELLGRGGMGEVYRAYDTSKDRIVALKVLKPALAADPEYRERFRRESRTAARLGEPHVIPIHDWGEVDGALFIDMRLVEGSDLKAVIHRAGRLAPARAVAIVDQIASALDAAHADRLIHRDVKPENILVAERDFAYLVDFGIANADGDTRLTQTGGAIGSVSYMAPELFDGAPAGPASDVYALTCVLYECLTGSVPYPADGVTAAIKALLTSPIPTVSAVAPGLPSTLDAVIARGLDHDPARRHGSAGELAAAAAAALRGKTPPPPPRGPGGEPQTRMVVAPDATAVSAPVAGYSPTRERTPGPAPAAGSGPLPPGTGRLGTAQNSQPVPSPTVHSQPGYPYPQHSGYQYVEQPPQRSSALVPVLIGVSLTLLVLVVGAVAYALLSQKDEGDAVAGPGAPSVVVEKERRVTVTSTHVTATEPRPTETRTTPNRTVRTYEAPTPDVAESADPDSPGYVPPPPPLEQAPYFAQFGAFNDLGNARDRAAQHYGSVVTDGSLVGLDTNYVVVRPTNSLAEAQQVCSNFSEGTCYVQPRAR
ncbi:MAG: serine/threonine-protein kinase [Gordonia sp. (in: high G+C Gram-positive bacteria)]|uniref:serine/threonine-protein kinase n=1 Tax=Gordonia sp. (in: high G+C Gram-positive bacteria) TaxID=84139 RepID=UPI0039E4DE39